MLVQLLKIRGAEKISSSTCLVENESVLAE